MGQLIDHGRCRAANENRAALADEIRDLQTQIESLAQSAGLTDTQLVLASPASMEREVRRIIELRADRVRLFGEGLFGEPAWDMLLNLYADDLIGRSRSVSSICLASGVPASTALRWLQHLQREGWVEKSFAPQDDQRFFLALSDKSRIAMKRFFAHPERDQTMTSDR